MLSDSQFEQNLYNWKYKPWAAAAPASKDLLILRQHLNNF